MSPTRTWSVLLLAAITSLLFGARLGLLAGFLLAAACTDMATRKIPNLLVLVGMVAGLLSNGVLPDGGGFLPALKGMGIGFALFLPLYLLRAMGAGDVKLMAMVGSFTTSQDIIGVALSTLLTGGILSLLFAVKLKSLRKLLSNLRLMTMLGITKVASGRLPVNDVDIESVGTLPYALAIAIGTAAYLVWQHF